MLVGHRFESATGGETIKLDFGDTTVVTDPDREHRVAVHLHRDTGTGDDGIGAEIFVGEAGWQISSDGALTITDPHHRTRRDGVLLRLSLDEFSEHEVVAELWGERIEFRREASQRQPSRKTSSPDGD